MNTYKVTYSGNATRFRNFESTVNADSEREAVENVYQQIMDENYFPQEDGSIKDCDGHTIAEGDDDCIEYDGGSFSAEIEEEDEEVEIIECEDGTFNATIDGKDYNYDNYDELVERIESKGFKVA